MSRKSKRRRNRFGSTTVNAGVEGATFEFVDDRSGRATAADFVVTGGGALPASESVPSSAAGQVAEGSVVGTAIVACTATAATTNPPAHEAPQPPVPPIPQPTLGEVLVSAREARGLTLEEASARTRISIPTLRNLEGDRFDAMAAAAYARGFLRSYGTFLGLDVGKLLRQYEAMGGQQVEAAPELWEQVSGRPVRTTPKWAVWVAAAMGIAVVAGGVVYGMRSQQTAHPAGAGLQQIEDELRAAHTVPSPAPVSAAAVEAPSNVTPQATESPNTAAESIEDTVAPEMPRGRSSTSGSTATTTITPTVRSQVTDWVEEPAAVAPASTAGTQATAPTAVVAEAAAAAAENGLVLTVTARDSCALRLQIDADARNAKRYRFAQPGETHSWSARRSFRLLVQQSEHLEVRLNGKLMRVPDGRTLVLDRESLSPAARPARRTRRPRPTTKPSTPPAASTPASTAPSSLPPHLGGGPPPR